MSYNVAAIDIGSNSIKLLVANQEGTVHDDVKLVRIGAGLGKVEQLTITDERIEAAVDAASDLLKEANQYDLKKTVIVATSAVRDASNKDAFCEAIKKAVSHEVQILSGVEEAEYISNGIQSDDNLKGLKDFLLFDLGGGSLELILYKDGDVIFVESLQLGGVRLTEAFIQDPKGPITDEALDGIYKRSSGMFDRLKIDWKKRVPLVGLGGVFWFMRKALELEDRVISKRTIKDFRDALARMTFDERIKVKGMPKGRADIMPTELTVILALMNQERTSEKVMHSSCNLRHGVVSTLL